MATQTENSYPIPNWIDQWAAARSQGVPNMIRDDKAREVLFGLDVLTLAASELLGGVENMLFIANGDYTVKVGTGHEEVGDYKITEQAGILTIALTEETRSSEVNKGVQRNIIQRNIEDIFASTTPPEPAKLIPYELLRPVIEEMLPRVLEEV